MHSAIYRGWLDHRRTAPKRHAFRYPLFMLYLDLAELDTVFARRWLWSTRRPAFARFRRGDHLGDAREPLDEAVRKLVTDRIGHRPRGPIRLLTHLRYGGYVFNPVSFYYCFDAGDRHLEAVVAEVNNTPWGEQHCYVLDGRGLATGGQWLHARSAKAMHVSPFHPMALDYQWSFRTPGERLAVRMGLSPAGASHTRAGHVVFDATLAMQRLPINARTLAATLVRFPLMTLRIILGIHWQALRLWIKGVPVHDHPAGFPLRPTADPMTRND